MPVEEISLRSINQEDVKVIAELVNDIDVVKNLRDYIPFPYTIEDAKDYIHFANKDDDKYIKGIICNGQLCGVIGLAPMSDVYRHTIDLGYWLGKKYWGRGVMTIAVNLFVEYIFESLNVKRIQAGVFSFNIGSKKVLEKTGFVLEAIHVNHVYKQGRFWDEHMYVKFNNSL